MTDDVQSESEADRGVTEIECTDCGTAPRLKSLNKNRGTQLMCDCDGAGKSLDAVPYELGVPELPDAWEVQGDDGVGRGLYTDGGEPEMKSIECPNCGMPFDVPEEADHWSCDCGASWELDPRTDGGHVQDEAGLEQIFERLTIDAEGRHTPALEVTRDAGGMYGFGDDEFVQINVNKHSTDEYVDIVVSAVSGHHDGERHDAGVKLTLNDIQRQELIEKLAEVEDA